MPFALNMVHGVVLPVLRVFKGHEHMLHKNCIFSQHSRKRDPCWFNTIFLVLLR